MAENEDILGRPAPEPDALVRYGSEPEHVADVWLPEQRGGGLPLVLLVHGGFWRPAYDRVHTRNMAAALRDAGWPVAALEYRRVPRVPDATTEDVRSALRRIPEELAGGEFGLGRRGTALIGHSAGGHLVLWAAGAAPPERLVGTVALAPVADLVAADAAGLGGGAVRAFLGGAPGARPDLDPVRVAVPATPVTLVHGVEDATVPVAQSRGYAAAHASVRLVAVPEAGHYEVIDPWSAAWAVVVEELARLSR